jgi:DNA-directed RNA polymerase subunit beta'
MRTFDLVETTPEFSSVRLKVAAPEVIRSWSHGEVLKPETINYRTQKPERDGLFCERIFGPTKDYECYCGKYKKIRYKGIICDKCGVEVTKAAVRRVRMGHIDLSVPVAHTLYVAGVPSMLGTALDMSVIELEKVIYFAAYVILDVNEDVRKEVLEQLEDEYAETKMELLGGKPANEVSGDALLKVQQLDQLYKETKKQVEGLQATQVISEQIYHEYSLKYGELIQVGIGAEAIHALLKNIDIDKMIEKLTVAAVTVSPVNKRKLMRRLKLFIDFKNAGIKPDWLVVTCVPVIPPDLRPMVQLDGGRYAASDLNDLYRRVLNRNNRLKKLLNSGAPEVITRNEKRMLQEAMDSLFDNSGRRGKVAAAIGGRRRLKSLSDMLRGKQGRFRGNLLGKRVDYSGRSVIVVGPQLKLDQCGLPKGMALELFKPFVIGRLISTGYVDNVRKASRLIEQGDPIVWDILEDLTQDHYVLLNRAPTLHRLGIQAFRPVLIEGKSIQIHPLVCAAYNADFDGDQMAVHVPLSKQAQLEAATIMRSANNLLKPASGEVIVGPSKDMTLGVYYLTSILDGLPGEGKFFSGRDEAYMAMHEGVVALRAKVKVLVDGEVLDTTVGQLIFNEIIPAELGYQTAAMDKKQIAKVIQKCYDVCGVDRTAQLVDDVKSYGFKYAEQSGVTFNLLDIAEPAGKVEILVEAEGRTDLIEKQYRRGLISKQERYMSTVEVWLDVTKQLEGAALKSFSADNPIMTMVKSGARGNASNINMIAGMKGLVTDPTGKIIEIPILHGFKQGLTVFEYFTSSHGTRKGRADQALRTADAGYLTRRLVDVAQDVVVTEMDCHTTEGAVVHKSDAVHLGVDFNELIVGRYLCGEQEGYADRTLVTPEIAKILAEKLESIRHYSPMYCRCERGICRNCYGIDPANNRPVEEGASVGIVAAQAIGEPGTQLTMRTFHLGGAASAGADITSGLPRVEELFEARLPKVPAVIAEIAGQVTIEDGAESVVVTITADAPRTQLVTVPEAYTVKVQAGDSVAVKDIIAIREDGVTFRAVVAGTVGVQDNVITITAREADVRTYTIGTNHALMIAHGARVEVGQQLTEGHLDIHELFRVAGRSKVERYIIREVQKIYTEQGVGINNKHIEIILKQMLSKAVVLDAPTTTLVQGQLVDLADVYQMERVGKKVVCDQQLLGITRVSLRTKSFLSAASFQETTAILVDAAMQGKTDELRGLKENVIIGKLIPAGTGYVRAA